MKFLFKINNGIIMMIIGLMHTQFALSEDAFKAQFIKFSETNFFKISSGITDLPATTSDVFEVMAAFWFFYFGLAIIPLGLLVFSIERKYKTLPTAFITLYLMVILLGVYMIPNSGMTIFMLPHAIYMLVTNTYKLKLLKKTEFKSIETST